MDFEFGTFLQLRFLLLLDYQEHIGRKISLVAIYRRDQRRCADGANAGSRECKKEYRGSGGGMGDVKERQEVQRNAGKGQVGQIKVR